MTTLLIDDELGRQAKQTANSLGKTLDQFVTEVLQGAVSKTVIERDSCTGLPVMKVYPPVTIDPQVIREVLAEEGF